MPRVLWPILAGCLLILCIVFWIRSYWHQDWIVLEFPAGRTSGIVTIDGHFCLTTAAPWPGSKWIGSIPATQADSRFFAPNGFAGFGYALRLLGPRRLHVIAVPFWFPAWLLSAFFATVLKFSLRSPRPGLCRRCGYDLRASQGRCPECGQPVPSSHRPTV